MKNINVKLVIVILGVCSFLGFCFGIPATSEANPCKNDDDILAIRDGSGQIICRLLKKCPHGMGLNFKVIPGKIYPQGTKTSCPSCIKGKTYSNTYDYSLCQDCTKCQENEISTGQCIIDKDTTNCTGKCKEGFYRINSMCLPCSQCCGNGHDIKPPDCSVGTVSMNKRCSQETRKNCSSNETVAVDTGIDEKNHTKPPKSNNAVATIVIPIFVVAIAIVIFVGTVCHYSNLQNNHCLGNNNCDEITPSPTTSESVIEMFPPADTKHVINTTQPSLGRSVNNSRSNPLYADPEPIQAPPTSVIEMFPDSYINVPMSLEEEQTEQQDIGNPCQERLNMLVIHIPKELYVKICELLDQLDVFFQDHRMLGNELGMKTPDVEKLGDNPTDKLLKQSNISVDYFLNMLKEIRGNSSQSHQNPRVDKAIELVESWLDE